MPNSVVWKPCFTVFVILSMLSLPVSAWDWEAHGTLEAGDPVFNRPSTSFPPCSLSSNGTTVFYDIHSGYWSGGFARVEASGSINRPVLASYPAGTFDPANPCDNVVAVGGCEPLPFTIIGPFLGAPGNYDIVVSHCYNGDSGTYDIYFEAILFWDDFETGDLSRWTSSVP